MFSLKQKHFLAKREGKSDVVLTMDEAEAVLSQIREQDLLIAKYMEYVPDDVLKADNPFGEVAESGLSPSS